MKKFKTIDVWVSIILIIAFAILSLIMQGATVFVGYFVVGGWQLISMFVHTFNRWFTNKGGKRYIYHIIVAIIMLFGFLAALGTPVTMYIMVVMLFAAPVMAIYYSWICYKEVYVKMVRPLDQLK